MKFIHFADAHLDSPFRGLSFLPSKEFNQIYQAADQSLTRIVDLALKQNVDLVLIAGDTFDSNTPSPRAQLFFAEQIKRLTDQKIQVVMIFGNHDHMKKEDLLVTETPYFKLLGNGEKVEKATFSTKAGFTYDVIGFSYLNNHITRDMIPDFPAKGQNYTFGLMHAQEKAQTNNVYAPFTTSEVQNLNYDYFALGHIHARNNLSENPWIVYPGNIQGRHINEIKVAILARSMNKLRRQALSLNKLVQLFGKLSKSIWKVKSIKLVCRQKSLKSLIRLSKRLTLV